VGDGIAFPYAVFADTETLIGDVRGRQAATGQGAPVLGDGARAGMGAEIIANSQGDHAAQLVYVVFADTDLLIGDSDTRQVASEASSDGIWSVGAEHGAGEEPCGMAGHMEQGVEGIAERHHVRAPRRGGPRADGPPRRAEVRACPRAPALQP